MGTFWFAAFLFVVTCCAFTGACIRWKRAAFLFAVVMAVAFPIFSDTRDWSSWFDWAKRYSVVLPVCLLAFANGERHRFPHAADKLRRFFPWILALNVAEAGILELQYGHWINGVALMLLSGAFPFRWSFASRWDVLGFRDAPWPVVTSSTLALAYLLNPVIGDGVFMAVSILVIALLACLMSRDSHLWFSWRAYTLYFAVLLDSFVPASSSFMYPELLHKGNRIRLLEGTVVHTGWLLLNTGLVAGVLGRRWRAGLGWRSAARSGGRCSSWPPLP
jgi:hypothetical protein